MCGVSFSYPEDTPNYLDDVPAMVSKVLPTVVIITSTHGNKERSGSGFIISEDGYIITNYHIVKDNSKVNVRLDSSNKDFEAEVIGLDELMNIALLKLSIKNKLPYVKFNLKKSQKLGETIIVIGNPYNLGLSVSKGIISALNRNLNITNIDNFIQTDASINKGNSGGPIFNLDGEVIGLTSHIYSPTDFNSGIGFAIPSADLLPIIEELKKYSYIQRGWIGIKTNVIKHQLANTISNKVKGDSLIITDIVKDSPADKAGLKIADIILSYNGKKITSNKELYSLISSTSIGSNASVVILRDNKELTIKVKVNESNEYNKYDPEHENMISQGIKIFDMILLPINQKTRQKFNINNDIDGLYILEVEKNSLADKNGIVSGDIILSVNQTTTNNKDSIYKVINEAEKQNKEKVILIIKSNNTHKIIPMQLNNDYTSY